MSSLATITAVKCIRKDIPHWHSTYSSGGLFETAFDVIFAFPFPDDFATKTASEVDLHLNLLRLLKSGDLNKDVEFFATVYHRIRYELSCIIHFAAKYDSRRGAVASRANTSMLCNLNNAPKNLQVVLRKFRKPAVEYLTELAGRRVFDFSSDRSSWPNGIRVRIGQHDLVEIRHVEPSGQQKPITLIPGKK